MGLGDLRLELDRIRAAAVAIDPVFLNSPLYECAPLGEALDCSITLKVETLNPVRSFKGRGTETVMSSLSVGESAPAAVCASAGNLGQALAYCGAKRGIPVTVVAAATANPGRSPASRPLVRPFGSKATTSSTPECSPAAWPTGGRLPRGGQLGRLDVPWGRNDRPRAPRTRPAGHAPDRAWWRSNGERRGLCGQSLAPDVEVIAIQPRAPRRWRSPGGRGRSSKRTRSTPLPTVSPAVAPSRRCSKTSS